MARLLCVGQMWKRSSDRIYGVHFRKKSGSKWAEQRGRRDLEIASIAESVPDCRNTVFTEFAFLALALL